MDNAEPREVGMDGGRLDRFFEVIEEQIESGCMYGGSFLVARHGKIVAARGFGHVDPDSGRPARPDDVYCILSTTKPITATALLQRVDRGELLLADRVANFIPEFADGGKENVTVAQVLTHTSGFPTLPADWLPTSWADWDATIARICAQPLEHEPGLYAHYHAVTGSWILAEIVRRLDGRDRSFAELCDEAIFQPLGMKESSLRFRDDLKERAVTIRALDRGGVPFPMEFLEMLNLPEVQQAIVPGAVSYSTVFDLARFYQMWLGGGELDGTRLLSPAVVDLATSLQTGTLSDRLVDQMFLANGLEPIPANRGLGFFLRGEGLEINHFGTLASPRTFGHAGASSIMAWADPERELIFVGLTAGLVHERRNIPRWHRLSDLVQASVVA